MRLAKPRSVLAMAALLAIGAAGPVVAQTSRGGGGGNAQLVQQLQQLGSERTALQEDNARLKRELDDVKKERDSLTTAQQGAGARERAATAAAARSGEERAGLESDLAKEKERMQELIGKFRESAQALREVESDRGAKTQALAARDLELKVCTERNHALYDLNSDILDRFEHRGVWSALTAKESFTRLSRTRLENLADSYRDRARDQQLETAQGQAPSTSQASRPASSPAATEPPQR